MHQKNTNHRVPIDEQGMLMDLTPLVALSPLDGRYAEQCETLRLLFSEYGLIKHRVQVELAWLKALSDEPAIKEIEPFSNDALRVTEALVSDFSLTDAQAIKAIEQKTNHDVKAVEYWLRKQLSAHPDIQKAQTFIHFACTAEDINNVSYALALQKARHTVLLPALRQLITTLSKLSLALAEEPMVSRTHGQVATPTTMGKELSIMVYRLDRQYQQLVNQPILGKFNGAVGNYNAHIAAYPQIDWETLTNRFVSAMGLTFSPCTTQIEPNDYMAETYQNIMRINTILIDTNRDLWGYISLGYFKQHINQDAVGSSTMPHKINPIDFENSEGNLGLANALLGHFSQKLPLSRFQRDLTNSTVLRNIGVALGHTLLGYLSCQKGLTQITINSAKLADELDHSWALLAEPIQTVMRRYGLEDAYEQLKTLTRSHKSITQKELADFIRTLDLPEDEKIRLLALTPADYIGQAVKLAQRYGKTSSTSSQ